MTKYSGVPRAGRPLKPSNDTLRIATSLGRRLDAPPPRREAETLSDLVPVSAATVEAIIRRRALRATHIPGDLLAEAAWDMLLELMHAELSERRVTASILCKAAGVSTAVGRRWIDVLLSKGLCTRTAGADDPDESFVQLSYEGGKAMRGYFSDLAENSE
jgi:hypothetical protein